MSEQHSPAPAADVLDDLETAASEYRAARDAVEEHGREQLEALEDALHRARGLLAEFEDTATDTGAREFVNFAQFKGSFTNHVESLDEELPRRHAFEAALEAVDKRRLDEQDFERARDALEPAAALTGRIETAEDARDRLLSARQEARRRQDELRTTVAEQERLLELGEADLDAPVETLREPIDRWNGAVADAMQSLRSDAPAREAFDVLERAEQFPLVDLPSPAPELREYVETAPAGEESVTRLLEYADFSRSKLEHYVEEPDRFRRTVGTRRSVLESLTAEPLTVSWPPPPAEAVPWRTRALWSVAGSLVEDDVGGALRELAAAARSGDRYERLRTAAVATEELDPADRRRLESGAVEADLAAHREAIERIDETIADVPEP